MKTGTPMIVAVIACLSFAASGNAQGLPKGGIAHEWTLIEGVLPGSTAEDWGYSRREGKNLTVFLSEPACIRWAQSSKGKRLTINGTNTGKHKVSCHAGVNKAVMVGYFPPPLPTDFFASKPPSSDFGLPKISWP